MRLQISIWAENVPKGKDPFAVLTVLSSQGTSTLLGQTEVLAHNTVHPDWTKLFYLDNITISEATHVVVTLFSSKESLGAAVFEVKTVLGTKGGTLAKQLKNKSTLFMHVEQATAAGMLQFQFKAVDLINAEGLGIFNKSDPFFEIQRSRTTYAQQQQQQQHVWDTVFRSAPIKNNLKPIWAPSFLEMDALCSDQWNQPFRIMVYDHNSDGQHVVMGSALVTLHELTRTSTTANQQDIALSQAGRPAGKIIVMEAQVVGATKPPPTLESSAFGNALEDDPHPTTTPAEQDIAVAAAPDIGGTPSRREPTFANYVSGGCQLRMIVAIDATASNGDPRQETSLHHFQDQGRNAYEHAIYSLGSIVAKFDSDQTFPVWGFGAKVKGELSHCFALGSGAEVDGIQGILNAYRTTFRSGLAMSSPRDFSEVIRRAADASKVLQGDTQAYSILLLLTNGGPTDIDKTRSALQTTKDSPLSIVIVGVGEGTFDGVEKVVSQHNSECRENARYVHCRSLGTALDQIPAQLEAYFTEHNVYPRPEALVDDIEVHPYNEAEEVEVPIAINNDGKASVTGDVSKEKFNKFMKCLQDGGRELMKHQRMYSKHKRTINRMQQQLKRMFN